MKNKSNRYTMRKFRFYIEIAMGIAFLACLVMVWWITEKERRDRLEPQKDVAIANEKLSVLQIPASQTASLGPWNVTELVPTYPGFKACETTIDYIPLKRAERPWTLAVSFPHMKDSYWLAVNFGVVQQAKQLGVRMRLYQAGGYDNLPVQIAQIKQAVEEGADGVIIGAISYEGLDELVNELHTQGVPVIDLVNGMRSQKVSARSLVSFEEMGYRAGEYVARRHSKEGGIVKVAWFPGPQGAGWVSDGDKGFRRALADSSIDIIAVRYGDTGKATQTALIQEVLDTHLDIDYVVGTAVTAAAAVKVLRDRGLSERIQIMSYYLTPEVYREIKRGRILGAPTDSAVIQGRAAVDQLVRVLEQKPYLESVGPRIYIVNSNNEDTFERTTSMAPSGFQATYAVNMQ